MIALWQAFFPVADTVGPEQTALVGQIETEMNCLPVENAEYKRIMDARIREAMMRKPKRETQMVERQPDGRVYVPTGGQQHNAFELGFTVHFVFWV